MFQHYLKLQNKISAYKDMINQFKIQLSNLVFEAYATNSKDKIKEINERRKNYKKTIKMYEDLIQKLENQLKNEFTEYVV
jgi:hypothetical protein